MTTLLQRWYIAGGQATSLLSEAVASLRPGDECATDGAFLHRVELVLLGAKSRGDLVMVCAWLARIGATSIVDAYSGDTAAVLERLATTQTDLKKELDDALMTAQKGDVK